MSVYQENNTVIKKITFKFNCMALIMLDKILVLRNINSLTIINQQIYKQVLENKFKGKT